MSKHAPTPWKQCLADKNGCSCGMIWSLPADAPVAVASADYEEAGIHFDAATARANAEFIVRAVNSHADMAEALRRARGYVSMLCEEGHRLASRADLDAVDAAIAKAEGREP